MLRSRRIIVAALFTALVSAVCGQSVLALTITHAVDPDHQQAYVDYVRQRARDYEKLTGVHIDVQAPSSLREQIPIMAAGGALPDAVSVNHHLMINYEGLFLDLMPFLEADEELSEDDFYPVALDAFRFAVDGKLGLYALPFSIWTINSGVNIDIMEGLGLPSPHLMPAHEWTWDKLKEYSRKITRDTNGDGQTDLYAMVLSTWIHRWAPIFRHAGAPIFNRDYDPDRVMLDQPGALEAVKYLQELRTRGWVGGDFYEATAAIMYLDAGPTFGAWTSSLNSAWIPNPMGPAGNGTEFVSMGCAINAESRHPVETWKWLKFLWGDPEGVRTFCETTGRPPVLMALGSWYGTEVLNTAPNGIITVESLTYPGSGPRPVLRNTAIFGVIQEHINLAAEGQMSPTEALHKAQQVASAMLRESRGE